MFKLQTIQNSLFGGGKVYIYQCTKCGHTERVASPYKKDVIKRCSNCNEPNEVTNETGISCKIQAKDIKRIKGLLKRIIEKCTNTEHKSYYLYNDINVYGDWVENPDNFVVWSLSHDYRPWYNLYRINDKKDYTPENCYWAELKHNNHHFSLEEYTEYNERLLQLGLSIETIAKNIEEYKLSKDALEEVIKMIAKCSSKNKLMSVIEKKLSDITEQLKKVSIMMETYNYMENLMKIDSTKVRYLIDNIKQIKKEL